MTAHPPDLQRKFDKKIDERKTIQLSPEEIDLLVECGAYDKIVEAARDFRKKQCRERSARSRSISAVPSPSIQGQGGTSKLSGTMKPPNGSEALARAQAMLGKGG